MLTTVAIFLQEHKMYLTLAQSDFSTCEVSDALVKLGVPHGGHIPDIYCISPHSRSESGSPAQGGTAVRLCGPAYTVRMVLASDRDAPKLQHSHFVDLAPEGSVAFVSAPSGWSRCSVTPVVVIHYPWCLSAAPLCSHPVFRFDLLIILIVCFVVLYMPPFSL